MNKISVLIVTALLGGGLCDLDVVCNRHEPAPFQTREAEKNVCFIDSFPASDPREENYIFHANYAQPSEITELYFAPSAGVYRTDNAAVIEYIPSQIFIDFPNLTKFRMSTNLVELKSGDFIHAMNLTTLNLQDNKLKIVRNNVFSPLTKPDTNEIPRNSEDSVFPLHKLRELVLFRNEISEIEPNSFSGLNNLKYLLLQYNELTVLHSEIFAGLPSLTYLVLHNNEIETIEDGALDLPALERLDLASNKLKRLSDTTFERLPKLEVMNLEQNDMEHIGQSLYRLPNVKEISLNWNQIEDIDLAAFAQLPKLQELDLTHSGFTFATQNVDDGRRWNSSLIKLSLHNNNLSDATELNKLRIFPNLQYLGITSNALTNLEVAGNRTLKDIMPSLKLIYFVDNKMSRQTLLATKQSLEAQNIRIL